MQKLFKFLPEKNHKHLYKILVTFIIFTY